MKRIIEGIYLHSNNAMLACFRRSSWLRPGPNQFWLKAATSRSGSKTRFVLEHEVDGPSQFDAKWMDETRFVVILQALDEKRFRLSLLFFGARKKFKVAHLGQSNLDLDPFCPRRDFPLACEFIVSKSATQMLQSISAVILNSHQSQTGVLRFRIQLRADRVAAV